MTFFRLRIKFWAYKPTAAMQEICRRLNGGQSWKQINGTIIN